MDHDFEFLRRVPLFARLSLDEQKYVRRLCEQARFGAGEALISEGQPGQAMFVIIRGRVDVRSSAPDGSTSLVAELGPGAHVGEMALIDDAPTSASVVARETVYSFRLARDQFEALLSSNQRIQLRIYTVLVQTLVKRLREANAKLAARHD
jgi:CRP-like cAMP-binding protein